MTKLFETGVRPLIDAYLAEQQAKVRDYGDYWSASSAGYCMRLNIMKRMKVPAVPEIEESEARQTRVFEAGHIFHEWVQRITKNAGISVASELELQDEKLMIRGHFDDLIKTESGLILYDYKTANSQAFNYEKEEIGYYHKMQLGTYMYMLADVEPELKEARILQISKDDLRMREFQLLWTPELHQEVVEYWQELNKWWADKKVPPCTCLDKDGGFMGRRSKKGKVYNPFFYEDEPCSLKWYKLNKGKKDADNGQVHPI
jgi:CRISPR/Cas system-associated exonuclease Cas4 (RecB family)